MYSNTSRNDFIDTFVAIGRADIGDGNGGDFTIDALHALFDYLEDFEESTGEQLQFDPVGLCCQFSEYESAMDAVQDRDPELAEQFHVNNDSAGDAEGDALEWITGQTTTICFNGGIVIDSEF